MTLAGIREGKRDQSTARAAVSVAAIGAKVETPLTLRTVPATSGKIAA